MNSEKSLEMKRLITDFVKTHVDTSKDRINGRLKYEFLDCSYEEKWLNCAFLVEEWMLNPSDTMHGGITCTAFDIVFGTLTVTLSNMKRCPTVELNVNYLQPIPLGDRIIIKAVCKRLGQSLAHLTGEAVLESNGKLCATATAIFFTGGNGGVYTQDC